MKKQLVVGGLVLVTVGILASRCSKTALAQTSAREILPLQLEEQIPVPGVAGRLDHFTADEKRRRLFVSALGNNTVEVIDVFAGRVVHSIKGLAQPQGRFTFQGLTSSTWQTRKTAKCGYTTARPTRFARRSTLAKIRTTCGTTKLPRRSSSASARTTVESPQSIRRPTSESARYTRPKAIPSLSRWSLRYAYLCKRS
jgi:hypothetical protein